MTNPRHAGSLLKELDLDKKEVLALLDLASELKHAKAAGSERQRLVGRNIALIFEKASTRTRCAFEVAAYDQGAHVTYLGPEGSHIGSSESLADTARVLGRMFDGIEFRGFAQASVEQLADYAGVPVWNGLTTEWHPTQMLADVLTMSEHHQGPLEQIAYCFVGDGHNNVARSLLITGALLGMDVRIAAPRQLWPPADVIDAAHELAAVSGARVLVTADAARGVEGVGFVYTDVWVSMGESEADWAARIPLLLPYRVTPELMASTGRADTKFLHCLPSLHNTDTELGRRLHKQFGLTGAEVSNEVFESPASIVFDQAENRLHTIKAVMVNALGTEPLNSVTTAGAASDTTVTSSFVKDAIAVTETSGAGDRFLVGVDGSEQSIDALRWAASIAAGTSARVEVLTTWKARVGMAGPFVVSGDGTYLGPEDDAQALLARVVAVAFGRDRPPNLTLSARQGDAAHILIEESKTAQLLVIGSRGLGEVAGLLLGSVSARCAEQAHCPVLIMHAPEL